MSRSLRQAKILDIISQKEVTSQEELADELKKLNFEVNQSTISRDIKELGLVKVMLEGGRSKYAYVDLENVEQRVAAKFVNMYRESVLSVEASENLIVIKTLSGSANAAAMAIDKMNVAGILGCVAGDDTVLLVAKSRECVGETVAALTSLLHP